MTKKKHSRGRERVVAITNEDVIRHGKRLANPLVVAFAMHVVNDVLVPCHDAVDVAATGQAEVAQLVTINLTEIIVKASWIGPGRLHLVPRVNAPEADFPVRHVVGAHDFLADLTLPYGRVVYDYNLQDDGLTQAAE